MVERRRGTGSQLMGFTLTVIAWLGCLTSMVMKDWTLSVVTFPEKTETLTDLIPTSQFNESSLQCNGTCNYTFRSGLKESRSPIDFNDTFYKIRTIRVKPAKVLVIGQRGLWYECTFLPIFPKSYVKEMKVDLNRRYRYRHTVISQPPVDLNLTTRSYNATYPTFRHVHNTKVKIKQTKLLITHKYHLRGYQDSLYESRLGRQCNYIGLHRASCLLLGVRTVHSLSIICGCFAMFLSFFAIYSDVKIRHRLRFHPLKKLKKNLISVISAMFCLLSGTFIIICCCWFTLENNYFRTSSYQTHHDRNNATFMVGDAVLVDCASGVVFIIAGLLLGTNVQAKSKTKYLTRRFLRKFKKTNENIEIHSTIL